MSTPELTLEDYEKLDPGMSLNIAGHTVLYSTPNRVTAWRAQTLAEKEPVTFEWVGSFEEGAVLVDVGANVGMYTILAGVTRKARVYAFEPESQNYALLCKNIVINQLGERVRAWPAALSDEVGFSELHLSGFETGQSCHAYGENLNYKLEEQHFAHVQGAVSSTLDRLVADAVIPVPDHVKIDVDGFEHKVVKGGLGVLGDQKVRSVLVELGPALPEHQWVIDTLLDLGYSLDAEQVKAATRTEGDFAGVAEHLFRR